MVNMRTGKHLGHRIGKGFAYRSEFINVVHDSLLYFVFIIQLVSRMHWSFFFQFLIWPLYLDTSLG
jgi:hypothetical protein